MKEGTREREGYEGIKCWSTQHGAGKGGTWAAWTPTKQEAKGLLPPPPPKHLDTQKLNTAR